ncbi:MAG: uroporphyrinogen-III C-methyltransferase [Gammaproteobacteria bacterium]|nr:uroporphyrinogen-III C-methyltransferase [Gammaproteobacteria bacterium]
MNETNAKTSTTAVNKNSPQETKKAIQKPSKIVDKKPEKQASNLSALFAFLFALSAIALSTYLYQQQEMIKQLQSKLQQQLLSIPQQRAADLAKLGSDPRIEQLQQNVQQLNLTQQKNITELKRQLQGVDNSLRNRINQVGHNSSQAAVLSEIEYLLRISHYQVNLLHNRNGAAKALFTAMQRVQALPKENNVNLLFNTLNQTVQQLNRVKTPEIGNTVIKLHKLEKRVETLSPIAVQIKNKGQQEDNKNTETNSIWKTLEKFVVVRQDGRVIKDFSSNNQQQTDEKLILKLGAARIALLRYEAKSYKNHIAASLDFVKNSYNINTESGRHYLSELNNLLNVNLSVEEINLKPAFDLIHNIRNTHSKNPAQKPVEEKQ